MKSTPVGFAGQPLAFFRIAFSGIIAFLAFALPGFAQGILVSTSTDTNSGKSPSHDAVQNGIAFLIRDADTWKNEKKCATCHHGVMTLWALNDAKAHGFDVDDQTIQTTSDWIKERIKDLDNPRDSRPGFNMLNTSALYLAIMAMTVPTQTSISIDEFQQISDHLIRHQESDGSWAWSLAPAKNRPPPFFESDKVVTLMSLSVLASPLARGLKTELDAQVSWDKAQTWLLQAEPSNSTQALAILLLRTQADDIEKGIRDQTIEKLLALQHPDGGWGQELDLPSDAYATGQALYFLNFAGVAKDRPEISRAVSYLLSQQGADGSWPQIGRAHPGETPSANQIPIKYFGNAWAVLGLTRSVQE